LGISAAVNSALRSSWPDKRVAEYARIDAVGCQRCQM
jgi:hypothetical protein